MKRGCWPSVGYKSPSLINGTQQYWQYYIQPQHLDGSSSETTSQFSILWESNNWFTDCRPHNTSAWKINDTADLHHQNSSINDTLGEISITASGRKTSHHLLLQFSGQQHNPQAPNTNIAPDNQRLKVFVVFFRINNNNAVVESTHTDIKNLNKIRFLYQARQKKKISKKTDAAYF